MVEYVQPKWQKQFVKFEWKNSNDKTETLELDIYNLSIMDVNRKKPEPPKKKEEPTKGYYEMMTKMSIKDKPLTPDDVRSLCATFREYLKVAAEIEEKQANINGFRTHFGTDEHWIMNQYTWLPDWDQDLLDQRKVTELKTLADTLTRLGVDVS